VAYAPEFYIPENIIGYTGVLNKNPTVYFLSGERRHAASGTDPRHHGAFGGKSASARSETRDNQRESLTKTSSGTAAFRQGAWCGAGADDFSMGGGRSHWCS
jgi:hypothetical protein